MLIGSEGPIREVSISFPYDFFSDCWESELDSFVEEIFLIEIVGQAKAGHRALNAFNEALQRLDADALHDHAADFLNHAAIVSKILSPIDSGRRSRSRAKHLCQHLGIEQDKPILDRTLRNHLEHIDERIGSWVSDLVARGGNFIDKCVGNVVTFNDSAGNVVSAADNTLRHFDPETNEYSVYGKIYNLQVIADSLLEVASRAQKRMQVLR